MTAPRRTTDAWTLPLWAAEEPSQAASALTPAAAEALAGQASPNAASAASLAGPSQAAPAASAALPALADGFEAAKPSPGLSSPGPARPTLPAGPPATAIAPPSPPLYAAVTPPAGPQAPRPTARPLPAASEALPAALAPSDSAALGPWPRLQALGTALVAALEGPLLEQPALWPGSSTEQLLLDLLIATIDAEARPTAATTPRARRRIRQLRRAVEDYLADATEPLAAGGRLLIRLKMQLRAALHAP